MAGDAKDLPHPTAPNFLDRTQQELRRLLGFAGNKLDRAVTWRDVNGGAIAGGQTVIYQGGGGGGGGGGSDPPDLTPPPDVTGLAASAGLTHVFVEWAAPTYTQGHGPGSTRIYAARRNPGDPNAVFADAVLSHEAFHPATLAAIPSEPNIRWHIWAKYVTVDGVESVSPAGGTNGVIVTTGQNVANLLSVLTGSITTSQLAAALNARIDLIDASAGVAGSVNQRIATETTARTALASTVTTLTATVNGNTAAIATEQSVRAAADGHLGALYTARVQLTQGGRTVVGGFGISGTSTPSAGPTIDFGVVANRFWIGAPAGTSGVGDVQPFIVQANDTVINGVFIPRGVYMDAAFINNLTALVARLGNAWIDNAMIGSVSAAKITAGFLDVARIAAGSITAVKIDTRGLTIKDEAGAVIFSSGQNLDYARVAGATKPKQFRVVARGLSSTTHPIEAGLYNAEDNSLLSTVARSYILNVIDRSTGAVLSGVVYDVYGDPAQATALANALNALGSNRIIVLRSFDEPQTYRLEGGLPAAVKRCGGTSGRFESSNFKVRGAYVLIGVPGCGEGNGIELYAGATDSDASAWIDTTFSLVNGNVVAGAASSLFQINAANVSTYIASAAIGTAQIGELHASKITAGTITTDRLVVGAATESVAAASSYHIIGTGADAPAATRFDLTEKAVAASGLDLDVTFGGTGKPTSVVGRLPRIEIEAANTSAVRATVEIRLIEVGVGVVAVARTEVPLSTFNEVNGAANNDGGGGATGYNFMHGAAALEVGYDYAGHVGAKTYRLRLAYNLLTAAGAPVAPSTPSARSSILVTQSTLTIREFKV